MASNAETTTVPIIPIGTTFEPKARRTTKHPGGQILLVTDGSGYYQEKGKPAQRIQKGDIVKFSDTEHWHGAAPQRTYAYRYKPQYQ